MIQRLHSQQPFNCAGNFHHCWKILETAFMALVFMQVLVLSQNMETMKLQFWLMQRLPWIRLEGLILPLSLLLFLEKKFHQELPNY
ncbi:hypothetical protein KR52_03770 [Synechococcus sp. KORDI-52]|nr:hypothetical protein KR52_03770 [Synechococcus sp. KORDI-52]